MDKAGEALISASLDRPSRVKPGPRRGWRGLRLLAACVPGLLLASVAWPHLDDATQGWSEVIRTGGREPPLIKAPAGPVKVLPLVDLARQQEDAVRQMLARDPSWQAESEVLPALEQPILAPTRSAVEASVDVAAIDPVAPESGPTADAARTAGVAAPSVEASRPEGSSPPAWSSRGRLQLEPAPPLLKVARRVPSYNDSERRSEPGAVTRTRNGDTLAEPGYRIQIAAMPSRDTAREVWEARRLAHEDLLGRLDPVIERAESSTQTFFRVQAGSFRDLDEAQQVCEQLGRRDTACVVVRR